MLGLGVTSDFTDFGFDGLDTVDSAKGDRNGEAGIRGKERIETVEFFEVQGEGIEIDGLTDRVDIGEVGGSGSLFGIFVFVFCKRGMGKGEIQGEEGDE